jgi:hypothetical protein
VPDLWIDEIIAAHKANIVLASLVRKVNVKGKRGDSITLPAPTRGVASAKTTTAVVALQVAAGAGITIGLTNHWEYSRLIEDIAEVHSLPSMRRFYTDDAGYALGKAKDTKIFDTAVTLQGGTNDDNWDHAVIGSDGSTVFTDASDNSTALTDAGIRRVIQTLDDSDIPMNDRFLVIPPVARRIMMGIARFSEQAFVGNGTVIQNGKLGSVYGVNVHVTTNCAAPDTATTVKDRPPGAPRRAHSRRRADCSRADAVHAAVPFDAPDRRHDLRRRGSVRQGWRGNRDAGLR